MVNLRINWTLYTGEECKAKTNCAFIAQFQTLKKHPSKNPTRGKSNVCLFVWFTIVLRFWSDLAVGHSPPPTEELNDPG